MIKKKTNSKTKEQYNYIKYSAFYFSFKLTTPN